MSGDAHDISTDFPAPRDDEPESLRADIIDELTDHLESAFHRELHTRTTDPDPESAARRRVLSRFGNPSTIARRLWYDAMQERIMSQKLTMAAAIVMACACLAMFGLMWRSIGNQQDFMATQQQHIDALTLRMQQDADEAIAQREQFQALLAESRELNRELAATGAQTGATDNTLAETRAVIAALTERLSEMEERTAAETSDWNPVELRLVQGTADGAPAVGFSVQMRITTPETGIPSSTGESDETGLILFERVRYGVYDVIVTAPWREYCYRQILLQPGESVSETIVCPAAEPEPLVVDIAVNWPDDLADQPIFMRTNLSRPIRIVGGDAWSNSRSNVETGRAFRGSDSGVWVAPSGVIHLDESPFMRIFDSLFVATAGDDEAVRSIRWPGADYQVVEAAFYAPIQAEDRARYESGEPMSVDTRLRELASLRSDRNELAWRVEEGTPGRIVLEPSMEAAETIRQELANPGAREARSGRGGFGGFGGQIVRLPGPLTNADLATAGQ